MLTHAQYHRFAMLFDAARTVEDHPSRGETKPYVQLSGHVAAAALREWARMHAYPVAERHLENEGLRWTAYCVSRDEYGTFLSVHIDSAA